MTGAATEQPEPGRRDFDIGDVLAVTESEQLDHDPARPDEVNDDEFADLADVPDGEVRLMSTAHLDDDSGMGGE